MIEPVGKYSVALANQRLNRAEVGHVAGGKQQRGGLADKCRKFLFEPVMRLEMPAHQMRRTRANAPLLRALLQRGDESRMVGQAKVIVAAKRKTSAPIDNDVR